MGKGNYVSGRTVFLIFLALVVFIWVLVQENSSVDNNSVTVKSTAPVPRLPSIVTIKEGALICFDRGDWEAMKANIADQNLRGMKILFDTGKCQRAINKIKVSYLDPVGTNAALIQMPSGKGGFVFNQDILQ